MIPNDETTQIDLSSPKQDKQESAPAEDPIVGDAPQQVAFTPPGLFVANFFEIYGAFKGVAGNTTVKPEQSRFLIAEAAKYAHAMLAIQFGLLGPRQ